MIARRVCVVGSRSRNRATWPSRSAGAGRPGAGDRAFAAIVAAFASWASLLFVALGKLSDLVLTAMARAVSFLVTGSVLLVAALLLQRFAPQVKAALTDDQPNPVANTDGGGRRSMAGPGPKRRGRPGWQGLQRSSDRQPHPMHR
jgi:hypothetical protein